MRRSGYPRKSDLLPDTGTRAFNSDPVNVAQGRRATAETTLSEWFDAPVGIALDEEVIGRGSFGLRLQCSPAKSYLRNRVRRKMRRPLSSKASRRALHTGGSKDSKARQLRCCPRHRGRLMPIVLKKWVLSEPDLEDGPNAAADERVLPHVGSNRVISVCIFEMKGRAVRRKYPADARHEPRLSDCFPQHRPSPRSASDGI